MLTLPKRFFIREGASKYPLSHFWKQLCFILYSPLFSNEFSSICATIINHEWFTKITAVAECKSMLFHKIFRIVFVLKGWKSISWKPSSMSNNFSGEKGCRKSKLSTYVYFGIFNSCLGRVFRSYLLDDVRWMLKLSMNVKVKVLKIKSCDGLFL